MEYMPETATYNAIMAGKTIESIDASSINVLKINFTDGTSIDLWAEISDDLPCFGLEGGSNAGL